MKLYTQPKTPFLIRINVKKIGEETEFITLCDTTQEKVKEWVIKTLENTKIKPFLSGNRTVIEIRAYEDGKNGKSISIPLFGLSPKEINDILLKNL